MRASRAIGALACVLGLLPSAEAALLHTSCGNPFSNGQISITSTTSGSLLVIAGVYGHNSAVTGVSDPSNGNWAAGYNITGLNGGTVDGFQFSFPGSAAGVSTVTVNLPVAATVAACVLEYSSMATSTPLDQIVSAFGTSGVTNWTSNNITTLNGNDTLVGFAVTFGAQGAAFSTGTNWGHGTAQNEAINGWTIFVEDQSVSSTSTYAATGTVTGQAAIATIASYKQSGGGTAPNPSAYIQDQAPLPAFDRVGILVYYRRRRDYLRAWLRSLPRRGYFARLDRARGKEFLDWFLNHAESEPVLLEEMILQYA